MAVTRLFQAGAEIQHVNEVDVNTGIGGNASPVVSSTKAKTGTYSFSTTNGYPFGKNITSTTQIRAGAFINHNDVLSTNSRAAILGVLTNAATPFCRVQWNGSGAPAIELIVNNVSVATVAVTSSGMASLNTWYHCAITYKASATVGFFSFYVDGVQKLTWSGNTATAITGVYMGGGLGVGNAGWGSTAYFDDFYCDDTVAEADAAPTSPRFPFLIENGAGNYTNWGVNTGTNTAALDDGVPDDDTTYTYATASGVKDSFALTNTTAGVTVPAGYSIEAVIPIAWAKKTDAGTASTLKVGTRLSATDLVGSAQTLATSYGPVWERQTTKPGGGAWTEANIDAAEIYLESAGSY